MDLKAYTQSNVADDGNIKTILNGIPSSLYTHTLTPQFKFQSDLIKTGYVYKSICIDFHQAHQNRMMSVAKYSTTATIKAETWKKILSFRFF